MLYYSTVDSYSHQKYMINYHVTELWSQQELMFLRIADGCS